MVVLDSSALIPLARVGRLDLVPAVFDRLRTTTPVEDEVTVEGQPGSASLGAFLRDVKIQRPPDASEEVAAQEGIALADASVILLVEEHEEVLLANDKALIQVARTHGVTCWWVTTLLLRCARDGVLAGEEAEDVLYDLVEAGMNLEPRVYVQVQRRLRERGT